MKYFRVRSQLLTESRLISVIVTKMFQFTIFLKRVSPPGIFKLTTLYDLLKSYVRF